MKCQWIQYPNSWGERRWWNCGYPATEPLPGKEVPCLCRHHYMILLKPIHRTEKLFDSYGHTE